MKKRDKIRKLQEEGFTYREIAKKVGLKSPATINYYIKDQTKKELRAEIRELKKDRFETWNQEIPTKRELTCENCGRRNPIWFGENDKWNKVAGEDISFLCMDCFALMYEEKKGETYRWELKVSE